MRFTGTDKEIEAEVEIRLAQYDSESKITWEKGGLGLSFANKLLDIICESIRREIQLGLILEDKMKEEGKSLKYLLDIDEMANIVNRMNPIDRSTFLGKLKFCRECGQDIDGSVCYSCYDSR